MTLCEQCGQRPPAFPGSRSPGGSRYCQACLNEKVNLILNVREVIAHYGVQEEI